MKSALLIVDVQQSFLHRPYWDAADLPHFASAVRSLATRARAAAAPILQIFHVENDSPNNPFSFASGLIRPLPELAVEPTEVFYKSVHSAMLASTSSGESIDHWLRTRSINHLIVTGIRTEQCCETTTRHASDLGYKVTFALDATLTFPMVSESGRSFSVQELRERTALVLNGRFADVLEAGAISP
jgi:nicotinamidase-related amidase